MISVVVEAFFCLTIGHVYLSPSLFSPWFAPSSARLPTDKDSAIYSGAAVAKESFVSGIRIWGPGHTLGELIAVMLLLQCYIPVVHALMVSLTPYGPGTF